MKKLNTFGTLLLAGSFLLQVSALCFHSHAAAGDVDLSFDPGSGVNGTVNTIAVQPDGKIIIGGEFTTVRGLARTNLARLNADGSGDATFNSPASHGPVNALALQPDGRLIAGGHFVEICDPEWGCFYPSAVVRLTASGSLDDSFTLAWMYDYSYAGRIFSLVMQPDGKVLVGGNFNSVNGTNHFGITRLNANGSVDASFNSGAGAGGDQAWVLSIALQPDGKMLVGGTFASYDGTNRNGIARLNADGSLDAAFDPGAQLASAFPRVESIALQPDGKLVVGGYSVARFNSDGTLDNTFDTGTGVSGVISPVVIQPDGKIIIGGYFTTVNGIGRNRIARLNPDGSLDSTFNPGTGMNAGVTSAILQSDGKLLVGGFFSAVNGTDRNHLARLKADGSLDEDFHPGAGLGEAAFSLAVQPDGKVLVGHQATRFGGIFAAPVSEFTFVNATNSYGSVRVNLNGSLDEGFLSAFNPNLADLIQHNDCVDDPRYSCQVAAIPVAWCVQSDGRVVISGYIQTTVSAIGDPSGEFIQYERFFVGRFHANGNRDTSFETTMANPPSLQRVNALAVQPDGKVIVAGSFGSIKGTNRLGIARLNDDGTLDGSFDPHTGATANNGNISSIALQPNGQILIGGSFTIVDGVSRSGIARLNPNGRLDASFDPGAGVGSPAGHDVRIALQSDGKVLVGGEFTEFNGTDRNGIARLYANGSLDDDFDPGTGVDGIVRSIVVQSDGKILIGGGFFSVNGILRRYVARLYGDTPVPSPSIARSNEFVIVSWPVSDASFQLQQTTNLSLPSSWVPVGQPSSTNGNHVSVSIPTTSVNKFYRLKAP